MTKKKLKKSKIEEALEIWKAHKQKVKIVKKKTTKKEVVKKKLKKIQSTPVKKKLTRNMDKKYVHSFRADAEIDTLLESVPNKSEYIKNALIKAFADDYTVTCPMCKGKGTIQQSNKKVVVKRNRTPKEKK